MRWNTSATGDQKAWTYPAYPADRTVQGVCAACNNQWLNDIEGAAKPYLLPAVKDRGGRRIKPRPLGEAAQKALSIWAYKTALVVGVKGGYAEIPVTHLHDFYEAREPPPSTRIWLASTTRRDLLYIDHRTITVERRDHEAPTGSNAFATTIGLAHIAFYVLCWTGPKPHMEVFFDRFGSYLAPILPFRKPVLWPLGNALTKEGVDELANVYGRLKG